MRILVLNGSPAGEDSLTLFTVRYWEKHFPEHEWQVLHVGQRIRAMEKDFTPCREALEAAELIVFCYPVYTFLVPAQLHRFLELIREYGVDLRGKFATQLSTSKHFYDVTAHRFIRENCDDLGLRSIRGLSADMEDLLQERGRREALDFFKFVCESIAEGWTEPPALPPLPETAGVLPTVPEQAAPSPETPRAVIVTDLPEPEEDTPRETHLRRMIARLIRQFPGESAVVNLRKFPFAGGCLGCFHCAADGTCVYKDGFDAYLRDRIQTADALVYAFMVRDHSMGYRFKLYDDRQFCNGHRTVTMGKPVAYLVAGDLARETNLQTLIEARAQVGGNFLAGVATDERNPDAEIDRLAGTLAYAVREHLQLPKNFYGVGGLKIFRDLIWQMQGLMRADHRFYKAHGFYRDFPQKHRGRMLAMYAVGWMNNSPKLRKKVGGRMTEGMTLPYRKVLEKD
ncbi:MAG: NAD(P)H-dependent oxidoreductase [Clostridia bacterium]|nr:NAD(P)H-dependent oxidoreductase [Clostridia bacterium]